MMKIIQIINTKSLALSLIFISITGCIQEIDSFGGSNTPLIVTGGITNELGPHVVKLVFEEGYNTLPNYSLVSKAEVKVIDDLGNEELLTYGSYGNFSTSAEFAGVIGRSYYIQITLDSDKIYQSAPETLLDAPQLENVNFETGEGQVVFNATYQDDPEDVNYYRWRFKGTYEVFSPLAEQGPNDLVKLRSSCYPPNISSNKVAYCWVTEFDNEFLKVTNDQFTNGLKVENLNIYNVELTRKFDIGFMGEIAQYNLTKSAYTYWNAIENQLGNTGSIFETSNYQIKGNIRSVDNPEELVLGNFDVASVSKKMVFVDIYKDTFPPLECVTNEAGCYPNHCISCISYSPSSSKVKPAFWP